MSDLQDVAANDQLASSSATVKLIGLKATFQDEWPKKPLTVVERLAVHFQRFLALPSCPEITLNDPASEIEDAGVFQFIERDEVSRESFA